MYGQLLQGGVSQQGVVLSLVGHLSLVETFGATGIKGVEVGDAAEYHTGCALPPAPHGISATDKKLSYKRMWV